MQTREHWQQLAFAGTAAYAASDVQDPKSPFLIHPLKGNHPWT
ncbi:hypothetical protein OKW30_002441 [Paraburkholderia sp. Clong3]